MTLNATSLWDPEKKKVPTFKNWKPKTYFASFNTFKFTTRFFPCSFTVWMTSKFIRLCLLSRHWLNADWKQCMQVMLLSSPQCFLHVIQLLISRSQCFFSYFSRLITSLHLVVNSVFPLKSPLYGRLCSAVGWMWLFFLNHKGSCHHALLLFSECTKVLMWLFLMFLLSLIDLFVQSREF